MAGDPAGGDGAGGGGGGAMNCQNGRTEPRILLTGAIKAAMATPIKQYSLHHPPCASRPSKTLEMYRKGNRPKMAHLKFNATTHTMESCLI